MKNWLQTNRLHLIIIGIFVILSFAYFTPVISGKALYQSDVLEAQAMQKEIMDVKSQTGKGPLWTNSMYGGMPTYQIWVQYPYNVTTYVISFLKTAFPNPIDIVLCYFLGAYMLLCVLRMKPLLSAAGAIAFTFTSYNFIYIEAGHSNQAMAISFFAPILASVLLILKRRYLFGGVLTAFFLAVEIRCNHIQMSYYLAIALLILIISQLYHSLKKSESKDFAKKIGVLLIATCLAVGINAGTLWTTYEYGNESIRGASNLKSNNNQLASGLAKDYAYNWSQGVGEISTFLIPNIYGGATSPGLLKDDSNTAKTLISNGVPQNQITDVFQQIQQAGFIRGYWGEKSITSGPWYFGCIIIFLFVLGIFIVKNELKWWIVGTSLLFVFLAFGKNFPFVSDLFFNYFPLYNKFRAVESTLVIPALLIPLLSFLALSELINKVEDRKNDKKLILSQIYKAFFITAGFLAIVILFPTLIFGFKNSTHYELMSSLSKAMGGDNNFALEIGQALISDRISLARLDAIRSLVFISISLGLIVGFAKQKLSFETFLIILSLVILVDMWSVDKRFLNDQSFYSHQELNRQFEAREADLKILEDKSLDYRVLDLSRQDPFFNASASYFHKSVGGRHSARLQRYDELITHQFSNGINEDVLDMLNTKYLILPNEKDNSQEAKLRTSACGNAWFVDEIKYVNDANEEMSAITKFSPKKTAIVDKKFRNLLRNKTQFPHNNANIKLIEYHPDTLVYESSSNSGGLAVFSEIWYDKGWNAYIDENKVPIIRANYLLRSIEIPAGKHTITFKFEPKSYILGEWISLGCSILMLAIGIFYLYTKKSEN